MKYRSMVTVIAVVLCVLLAAYFLKDSVYFYSKPPEQRELLLEKDPSLHSRIINFGLDMQGGTRMVLEIDTAGIPDNRKNDAAERTYMVIQNRVDHYSVKGATLQKQWVHRLIVEIPGVSDPQQAKNIVQARGQLEFMLLEEPSRLDQAIRVIDGTLHVSGRRE